MKKIGYSIFVRFLGIVLFIYILSKINLSELTSALQEVNLAYYLIAVLFFIVGILMWALKWKMLVSSIGAEIPFKDLIEIFIKGLFLGMATPGKVGEFWKAKYLSDKTGAAGGKTLYTVFADKAVNLLVVLIIGLMGAAVIYLKFSKTQNWLVIALSLFLFIVLSSFCIKNRKIHRLFGILIKFFIPHSLKERADFFLSEFYREFRSLKPGLFFKIVVFGFLYYFVTGAVASYFIVLALGISLPFWYVFLTVSISWLVTTIPITILGLGTREATFIYFFSFFGISAPLVIAFTFLSLFCNILVVAVPGIALFLKQKL